MLLSTVTGYSSSAGSCTEECNFVLPWLQNNKVLAIDSGITYPAVSCMSTTENLQIFPYNQKSSIYSLNTNQTTISRLQFSQFLYIR